MSSTGTLIEPSNIRARFGTALSDMYQREVPLYGDLLDIVAAVNARSIADQQGRSEARIEVERHGAIRVGTGQELALLARAFAVMGMTPVGYYDLSAAGVPVHSTAFRPVDEDALAANPFRVFCSLLRTELINDSVLRAEAEAILARRSIVSQGTLVLIEQAESQGGLDAPQADAFIIALLETFRWHEEATVDLSTYERLAKEHRLVADIVAFRGPHINHLTPRTLDIDAVQVEMGRRGIDAKQTIEGPPRREVPILLRQTSFHALTEPVHFVGQSKDDTGGHTARFGEIEQRGAALTLKGRALYDRLLAQALAPSPEPYPHRLADAMAAFPDDMQQLIDEGLIFVRRVHDSQGQARLEPITYEDFLPVSAAGIFQSNLGADVRQAYDSRSSQAVFEAALGRSVEDPFALYEAIQAKSLAAQIADASA